MDGYPADKRSWNRDKLALENWENWMKVRKEECERLSKALATDPTCLLMNRDSKWDLDREKDVMLDAQLIKEYRCRCGVTGCPLFWKTTEPSRPGAKNLLAEVLFSPVKLTHENKKLSHLVEDGYVGQPRAILEEKGILGDKCFLASLKRWKDSPYFIKKREELKEQIAEVKNFKPDINELIVLGKTVVDEKLVSDQLDIPDIIVEDYCSYEQEIEETVPILCIGKLFLKGGSDSEGINWTVEFTVHTQDTHVKYVKFKNKGQIAINFRWKKRETYTNPELPLSVTRDLWTRFFFDKSDGILLPGQTFNQMFWFRSRTPGLYKETWYLETKPRLPPICFFLEAVVSKRSSAEKHENNVIDNYLKKLVAETTARDMAAMVLHRVPIPLIQPKEIDDTRKFSEKEIFMHKNPALYFHFDIIERVKKLHKKYLNGVWNYSMIDLYHQLMARIENEERDLQDKVMKSYSIMYRKLQKKPLTEDFTDDDWETYKYHLSYLLMCAAIAEMEKSLNYKSWGLKPPNAPPGPKEDYEGSFTDSHSTNNTEFLSDKKKFVQEDSDSTLDREIKIRKVEKEVIKEFGYDALTEVKTVNLNLGFGVKFTKETRTIEEEEEDEIMDKESELEDTDNEPKNNENQGDLLTKKNLHFKKQVDVSDIEEEELLENPKKSQEPLTNLIIKDEMRKKSIIINDSREEDGFIDGNDDETSDETVEEEANYDADHKRLKELENKLVLQFKSQKANNALMAETNTKQQKKTDTKEVKETDTEEVKKTAKKEVKKTPKKEVKKTAKKEVKKKKLTESPKKSPGKKITEVKKGKAGRRTDKNHKAKTRAEKKKVYRGGDPALFLKRRKPPPPYVRKRFLYFAKIQWRQILQDTIDDIVVLIESINMRRSVRPRDDIKQATRMKYCE